MVVALRTRPAVQPRIRTGMASLHHPVRWFTPQPLWRRIPREELVARREQPVLLRFAGDNFMDELLALLATQPLGDLASYVAQPETWRDPDVGLDEAGRDKPGRLKLYQPSHNRFYLVTGALACRIPGVPDRTVDTAAGESVFFVLRRLHEGDEYAWSTSQSNKGWIQLARPDTTVLPDEERHPLFPIGFTLDGVPRRLFAGLVPVASRDTYRAEGTLNPLPSAEEAALPGGDSRPILFERQVTASLQGLQDWYSALTASGGPGVTEADQRLIDRTSVYTFLDLMGALRAHVRPLYDVIMNPGATVLPLGGAFGLALLIAFTAAGGRNLVDVLRVLEQDREQIEALGPDDDLDSDWVFPFVGSDRDFSMWLDEIEATITIPQPGGGTRSERIKRPAVQVLFHQALSQPCVPENEPSNVADPVAMVSTTLETPKLDPQGDATYVLRLV
ncbi:MAG TPA: hypothetical protein VGW38_12620, partial [Chloroflexota bacterium]|nr:hypothetical protein [Chloroflexota bacterium]